MANDNIIRGPDGKLVVEDGPMEEVLVQARREPREPELYYNPNIFLRHSFLKSAKFFVRFEGIPPFIASESVAIAKNLSFLCDSVEFPGQSLTSTEFRIPGKLKLKVPYLREINEVTFSFYHNTETPVYNIFKNWTEGSSIRNTQNRYFDDLVCKKITIMQFSEGSESYLRELLGTNQDIGTLVRQMDMKKYMTVELQNAFPLNFSSMPSNWADEGFHKITSSFFFEDVTVNI